MDALSTLLSLYHLRSSIDARCHLQGEWLLPHGAGALNDIRWHALLAGSARLEMPNGELRTLSRATVVMLPRNNAHRLLYHDENAHLLCGCLHIDPGACHWLTALPEMIIYHEPQSWLLSTLQRLHDESIQPRAGQQALCDQLSLTLLTLALRHWLESAPKQNGILTAMSHPRLGPVIDAMLQQPATGWTVESLAQQSHLSRASFARQFRTLTGTTPLLLLTEIRMAHASAIIARQTTPLASIAEQVGYASESAFHKAFVRHNGMTPGDYRRRVQLANSRESLPPADKKPMQ